ncbi:Multiple RNA-binding domain-containing protein 1 [Trapelia coarctata]|nr:Multiple RNA-binding domain-containing protein 1 [Trapelia coarctata]
MEVSRIFVRGLPPNFSAENFKKHFSKLSPVTDARFIPHRRIGYVGYRTHNEAAKAVKYFDRSYIRMSRIAVELARPIEEQIPLTHTSNKASLPDEAAPPLTKRKLMDASNDATNPKLQEFLKVMQPPSKSKVWANEDTIASREGTAVEQENLALNVEDEQSDDQYQPVPKKRKKSAKDAPDQDHERTNEVTEPKPQTIDEQVPVQALTEEPVKEDLSKDPVINESTAADADWIRSRTSRLLGLVDEDDLKPANILPPDSVGETEVAGLPEPITAKQTLDAESQADGEPLEQNEATALPPEFQMEESITTARLFIRNLSYTTSQDDLRDYFSQYGAVSEAHVAVDARTGTSKGFAYVQYQYPKEAYHALEKLDGKPFQGRLLHILPASAKKQNILDDYEISKLPIKKQKQIKRKAEAASSTFKWNSLYMNTNAIMSSISSRLGILKSELLDPTSSDAAVKQAHAETNIIQETKAYFTACGVDLEAFNKREFSDTAILVKNFPYGTNSEDLRKAFEAYGTVEKLLMPPSGTIAIVEYEQATQARSAFGALSYRKFKDSILFLEKAPKDLFASKAILPLDAMKGTSKNAKPSTSDLFEDLDAQAENTATLFVRNLNFSTTTERLREVFQPLDGFLSAKVKTKLDPKKPGQTLSMGFGFLEFRSKSQALAALTAMNSYRLDGHDLVLKTSHKAVDAAEERRREDQAKKLSGRRTKVIIKNLPFEATKKDVRSLFGAYGKLRSVRVPRKFDSSTRGFAFADFVTAREAENAMDALRNTHLLGRRLVLDFAAEDTVDPEEEIEKMQKKVGRQADKVALQNLTGVGRKKFNVQGIGGDADD